MAERTVQTLKHSLIKASEHGTDLFVVLMDYRNTPTEGIKSPAELLMGRKIRTLVPTHPQQLKPQFRCKDVYRHLKSRQDRQHIHGDQKSKRLKPLSVNQEVWMRHKTKWIPAVVTQVGPQKRTYTVITEDGSLYKRNRFHLRPAPGRNYLTRDRAFQSSAEDYDCVPPEQYQPTSSGHITPAPSTIAPSTAANGLPQPQESTPDSTTGFSTTDRPDAQTDANAPVVVTRYGRQVKPPTRYTN